MKSILSSLVCVALCASAINAQTYEYSGTPKEGFTPASLDEAIAVLSQVTGKKLDPQVARNYTDVLRSYVSLDSDAAKQLGVFLAKAGNRQVISHQDGAVLIQIDSRGAVLRFASWKAPVNLFVRKIEDAEPIPSPKPEINPEVLRLFIQLLSPQQRVELFRQLKDLGVETSQVSRRSSFPRYEGDTYQFDEMQPSVD